MNRPLVSYAQNREDLYLWALLGHRTPGHYVDVGCYDEHSHSVTKLFYENGWSGLNIDANPRFEAGYQVRPRDAFLLGAIGAKPEVRTFRIYPDHDGLSTIDEGIKSAHSSSGLPYEDVQVDIRVLDDVLDEFGIDAIDFLKIDVEGAESDVLSGLDFSKRRPSVIVIEASNVSACEAILLPNRYHREFFDGLNMFYVDDETDDISIMNYAASVLHKGFYTAREQELRLKLEMAGITADQPTIRTTRTDRFRQWGRVARLKR